ncbi:MAG: 16S rRNA (uracil(1498)-N(3))-methyltransferase [Candidatus Krumholzibacteria bacterium]|nr:16S rRNA (uracil(1498)-N(3))-methyltransferase [Candidatus Krumholzibacteria bacterium]
MSSSRFFIIDPESVTDRKVTIEGAEAHHLRRVVRAKIGQEVSLLDGCGLIYSAIIREMDEHIVRMDIIGEESVERESAVDLALALFKPSRMEMAVEKCTELGIRKIIPFVAERSIQRGDEETFRNKRERLIRKVESASKQSGQPWFPEVSGLLSLEELISIFPGYSSIFLADMGKSSHDIPVGSLSREPSLGIIGPEGGLTVKESELLIANGADPVRLGSTRLRSETAAICLGYTLISR